jgi:hypothetical protein
LAVFCFDWQLKEAVELTAGVAERDELALEVGGSGDVDLDARVGRVGRRERELEDARRGGQVGGEVARVRAGERGAERGRGREPGHPGRRAGAAPERAVAGED